MVPKPTGGAVKPVLPNGEQMPSPEEFLQLLEGLQGMPPEALPADLTELLQNVKKEKGVPQDFAAQEVTPEPGFVIKTNDIGGGRKFFINVCGSEKVTAPGNWESGRVPEEVMSALENMDNLSEGQAQALRFPLSCGAPRPDVDRKGEPCTTTDVIISADVLKQAVAMRRLKAFLVDIALQWVGHKAGVELDKKYKLPKMRYKGEVVEPQRIRVDKKSVVLEVKDADDGPAFPLRTTKAPATHPTAPTSAAVVSSAPAGGAGKAPATSSGGALAADGGAGGGAGNAGASGSAAAVASQQEQLSARVEYVGRPVESIAVRVALPEAAAAAAGPSGAGIGVEVCGRSLFVCAPRCRELRVELPLGVGAGGAAASVGEAGAPLPGSSSSSGGSASGAPGKAATSKFSFSGTSGGSGAGGKEVLVVLPYLPLPALVEEMQRCRPLAYGQLQFASAGLLDLE